MKMKGKSLNNFKRNTNSKNNNDISRKFQKSQKKSSMSYSSNKFSESDRNKNLKYTNDKIIELAKKIEFDKVSAIESRGFIFAAAVSYMLNKPFILLAL